MKKLTPVFLMLAAVSSVPAYAEGKVATAAANETKLGKLTAEYTKRYRLKQYAEAIPIAEQAVAMAEAAFGPDDEWVAQALNDLGRLYESKGQLELAERSHAKALAIREQAPRAGPGVAQSMDNLAKVYLLQKRYAEAEALYRRSLVVIGPQVPSNHPALLTILEPYAEALRGDGKPEEAEAIEARIKRIRSEQRPGAGAH